MISLLAIDPGDVHNGVAYFELGMLDVGAGLTRFWTADMVRDDLENLVETAPIDVLVVEEFRLYPQLAREQGYSDFQTCQRIGVLDYLARKRGIPIYMHGGSLKRKARGLGEGLRFPGKERMIGTGRGKYWGWDFQARSQHERDATGHGVWWSFRNQNSPLFKADIGEVFISC